MKRNEAEERLRYVVVLSQIYNKLIQENDKELKELTLNRICRMTDIMLRNGMTLIPDFKADGTIKSVICRDSIHSLYEECIVKW